MTDNTCTTTGRITPVKGKILWHIYPLVNWITNGESWIRGRSFGRVRLVSRLFRDEKNIFTVYVLLLVQWYTAKPSVNS